MSFFKSQESFLGIDIGNAGVKIVECANEKGRPKLLTYGYIEQPSEILTSNSKESKEHVAEAIKRIQEAAHTTSVNAVAALPSFTVFTSIIHLPTMPKKELVAAVNWEAKKFVPMPLEEMILDWKILSDDEVKTEYSANTQPQQAVGWNQTPTRAAGQDSAPMSPQPIVDGASPLLQPTAPPQPQEQKGKIDSKKKQFLKILLTAAPKDLVSRYLEIFKMAKLNLVSLETESFALERALVGNDRSAVMLIDMGAMVTTMSVVVDAVPLINRSIDIGGYTITKAIANSLSIDIGRAEQFKRDFGLTQAQSGGAQIPKLIEFMVSSIVTEVKYVQNLYHSQGNAGIEKIILAGGCAWLPNMPEHLSRVLGTEVFIGDSWARVMYPVELQPVLESIGSRLAVAIGLAMREIN